MTEMYSHILITVIVPDRPGIIAFVSNILFEFGSDIEDVTMTRLSGNLAMMMVASVVGKQADLEKRLQDEAAKNDMKVYIEHIKSFGQSEESNIFISVIGPNRVGIVSAVSGLLAKHNANINEMTTQLINKTAIPVYIVRIEALFTGDEKALREELAKIGKELEVETRLEVLERADL
ncbi:MAG: ACT domain-containing protein [Candidatus Sumerlaeales bacterium]|nr:ACT domain-containing protein [Candidatus Sumerlaeales bacterium]